MTGGRRYGQTSRQYALQGAWVVYGWLVGCENVRWFKENIADRDATRLRDMSENRIRRNCFGAVAEMCIGATEENGAILHN